MMTTALCEDFKQLQPVPLNHLFAFLFSFNVTRLGIIARMVVASALVAVPMFASSYYTSEDARALYLTSADVSVNVEGIADDSDVVRTPEMMSKVHEVYPEVEMHWTEGGPDYQDPAYVSDWCGWRATFSGILGNWCRSIASWNLELDENGRPNIGPFSSGGVVAVRSQTGEISRSGQFWALAQYSHVIRRGANRFQSESSAADLQHVAFKNPDGLHSLIVTTAGCARTIELKLENHYATVPRKANTATTLAWSVVAQ